MHIHRCLLALALLVAVPLSVLSRHAHASELPATISSPEAVQKVTVGIRTAAIETSLDPAIVVSGNADEKRRVVDTVSTFATLDMPLPDLEIAFHDSSDHCEGAYGIFRPRSSGWLIDICSELAFVLPHELGHAWERATLTDSGRAAWMSSRGLGAWRHDEPQQAGIEDVAFVIQLAILGEGAAARGDIDDAFHDLVHLAAT
ncbi:MAG: hypothetical protein ACR2P0_04505 [Acidimicrobiales bacterium]